MEKTLYFYAKLLLLHSLMASLTALAAAATTNTTTDLSVLLSLKSHIITTTEHYNMLSHNWSSDTSICHWAGVTCSTSQRVTGLNISNMGITGTVPPQLGNLSFLVSLDLQGNKFGGELPTWFHLLPELKYLSLGNNSFNGNITGSLFSSKKLHTLILSYNSLQGPVPRECGNATLLEILNLGHNKLTGVIPDEIGNLHNLKMLVMTSNDLEGSIPLNVFNISSLEVIDLSNNSLSGTLPQSLCFNLRTLGELSLDTNNLHGHLPTSLSGCSALQTLSLFENEFSGSIPREIGNLTLLKTLFLMGNNLTGVIPAEMKNLHKLELFLLSYNMLTGPIPSGIFNNSFLKMIDLTGNHITGNLPSTIGYGLPNIQRIHLVQNNMDGVIPSSISNCSGLTHLDIQRNEFRGIIPDSLGNLRLLECLGLAGNNFQADLSLSFITSLTNCRYLTDLWISQNPLNGILPSSIGNVSSTLRVFHASNCKLKGRIPKEIGNLSQLIKLDLMGNDLIGLIPSTIRGLKQLQGLRLQGNKIEGSISEGLCEMQNLAYLHLGQNFLRGPIPECLGSVTSLRSIFLGSNGLTSTIPTNIWNLKDLLELNVSSNHLNGLLPLEMGNLQAITVLELSNNDFTGEIPDFAGGLLALTTLSLANNKFEGPIPEPMGRMLSLVLLDLSHNRLSKEIPKSFETLKYLKYFNVSFNELSGEIPTSGPFRNFTGQSFLFNAALCGDPRFNVTSCTTSGAKRKRIIVAVCASMGMALMVILLTLAYLLVKLRDRNKLPRQKDIELEISRRLSYFELVKATGGFSQCNLIGSGSYSSVYKGVLANGMILAVKVFKLQLEGTFSSFYTECEVLRSLRHRNLTKVISSCSNPDFKALVLEYMSNGSLEEWLHSNDNFLNGIQRLDIMIDVANALEYLHHGYSTPVVHCDIKPSNVLLDEDMTAHVTDFGVSKLLSEGESISHTKTLATLGYIAPEYGLQGVVSTKSDIYSFGILLMETFTRRRPSSDMFSGDLTLKYWIRGSMPNDLIKVIDPNLLSEDEKHLMEKLKVFSSIMELALHCCAESPSKRINMKDARVTLEKVKLQFMHVGQGPTE
ncbi:LRR receptor-like serine/threonine-protein kinase GSO1 [Lycium barbarum]|uniref:LRR receptor-like serine/threonine-protein kinase GSO1 n=1 Tax=Lycium barbarum TaxID=112863 RepID=UPI00293E7608|nr:LRR receptor-like serine/threonine-protein kinase GSO1 [Lycium barbarum]